MHVDKSFTKIQARVRPPPHSGNACILGASGPAIPPLHCEISGLTEQTGQTYLIELTVQTEQTEPTEQTEQTEQTE